MLAKVQGPLTQRNHQQEFWLWGKDGSGNLHDLLPQRNSNPKHFCPLTVSELAVELYEAKWEDWEMA